MLNTKQQLIKTAAPGAQVGKLLRNLGEFTGPNLEKLRASRGIAGRPGRAPSNYSLGRVIRSNDPYGKAMIGTELAPLAGAARTRPDDMLDSLLSYKQHNSTASRIGKADLANPTGYRNYVADRTGQATELASRRKEIADLVRGIRGGNL